MYPHARNDLLVQQKLFHLLPSKLTIKCPRGCSLFSELKTNVALEFALMQQRLHLFHMNRRQRFTVLVFGRLASCSFWLYSDNSAANTCYGDVCLPRIAVRLSWSASICSIVSYRSHVELTCNA